MASTNDDGFHEIQLNGKQLVFLFMAVTVVSVVIFLCGVLVGRGVRAEAAPSDQLVAQQAAAEAEPPPPPAASTTGSEPSPTVKENVSFPDRLASAAKPVDRIEKPAPTPAPVAAPASTTPPPAAKTATASPAAAAAPEPPGPGVAIQLTALAKREDAEAFARRLIAKGYSAYVVSPEAGAPVVYRVRVGKFKDERLAEATKTRLEKEEQLKPWIVR
jgi:DedD protein